jgi:hypothetical protein
LTIHGDVGRAQRVALTYGYYPQYITFRGSLP